MTRAILLAAAATVLRAAPARIADAPPDWLRDEGGVLEVKLAHEGNKRIDGGVLHVDPNHKVLLWKGIPGDVDCKTKLETKFEDVHAVRIGHHAGFTLELKRGARKKLVLLPLPHAEWFLSQHKLQDGLATTMAQAPVELRGPGGGRMFPSGSAASGAPCVKKVDLPPAVVRDTRIAARALQSALGLDPARP